MSSKVKNAIVIAALAFSVSLILWLTLFSRLGSDSRYFYPPFWSYRAAISGSAKAFFEIVGNVILFVPVGMVAVLILHLNVWQTVVMGFSVSLLIECSQWMFWLGSFEIDDLLHNTIGAAAGASLVQRTTLGRQFTLSVSDRKKDVAVLIGLVVLIILIPIIYQKIRVQTMVRYAEMNDRADGAKNLLVLSPDPKYIGQSDFNIFFTDDGGILIKGRSENRAWIEIGKTTLSEGNYSFSGLSSVAEKTVAIELEYYNTGQYVRFTQDVGPVDEVKFDLVETTKLRTLIGIYADAEGEYLIRPVIYREE